MKVIIAGGRDFDNYELLKEKCDALLANHSDSEIVCGLAKGADTLGEKYANERKLKVAYFPADWDKYKNRAGYLRNAEMANYADALILFWNGLSTGSANMLDEARKRLLKVRIVRY